MFYLACQTMAMTLFPTLGGTAPPWRWRRSILVSSLLQHLLYALTVCGADVVLSGTAPGAIGRRAANGQAGTAGSSGAPGATSGSGSAGSSGGGGSSSGFSSGPGSSGIGSPGSSGG